jgi:archaellum component FlaC
MASEGDREPEIESNPTPKLRTQSDKYLHDLIEKSSADMNQLSKSMSDLSASVDSKIEPLNTGLELIMQKIESFATLPENVEKIRDEFTGFRSFRERMEGYELSIRRPKLKIVSTLVGTLLGSVYLVCYCVWTISAISTNVGEMKATADNLQKSNYELNGTAKAQGSRLDSIDERLKALQAPISETVRIATQATEKASDRIAKEFAELEERSNKANQELTSRFNVVERKIDDVSDVLVLWLRLTPDDKPVARTDTTLTYELQIPPQERQKAAHAVLSKTFLAGAVNFFDGDSHFRPTGVGATALPMKEDGKIPVQVFFQDKPSLDGFEKILKQMLEARRLVRLKVVFSMG